MLKEKINSGKYVLGVTGSMGCGKTYACNQLIKLARAEGINSEHIDIDMIRRKILAGNSKYSDSRQKIINEFGRTIIGENGEINGRALGEIIFYNDRKMDIYRNIINPIIKHILQVNLENIKGLALVEWALLAEDNLLPLVDYNVLLVKCDSSTQRDRLSFGDLPQDQVLRRINYGLSNDKKIKRIKAEQKASDLSNLFVFDTSNNPSEEKYKHLLKNIVETISR